MHVFYTDLCGSSSNYSNEQIIITQESDNDISAFSNYSVSDTDSDSNIGSTSNTDLGNELLNVVIIAILDEIFSDGAFTKDEAKTYVEGEKELAEIIKNKKDNAGLWELLFNSSGIEKECREQYEKEHPEYAKVAKEGQKVQKQHDDALAEAKKSWQELNQKPTELFEKGGFFVKRTKEYKKWESDYEAFIKEFESEYKKKDPDYKRLSDEQNKDKSYADQIIADIFSILIDSAI